jgi:pimeloyl-ACP methyl ester carboxylesterase
MDSLQLADGRTLEYLVAGPEDGTPLLLHNGTPSAAGFFGPMLDAAVRHGLRLLTYSRPGYGGSTPRPGRSVASAAADVAGLLDALGAETFLTVGWSGGGPHALASAALLPGRCLAAATIGGPAPYDAEGLDWLDDMAVENVQEFTAAAAGEGPLTDFLAAAEPEIAKVRGQDLIGALGGLMSEVDQRVLTEDFAGYMARLLSGSVATGIAGWRDDDLAFLKDWGFDPAAITVPVAIWHGEQDRMVPFAHGRWLAAEVPGAAAHLEPDEGHLSQVVNRFDAVVAELATHLP